MGLNADGHGGTCLRLPPSRVVRDQDQRSAFGNFVMNAASTPLPVAIEHRAVAELDLCLIRRAFFGVASPIVNALVEAPAAGLTDVWRLAEAAVPLLSESGPPQLIKLFLAGSLPDHAPALRRIAGHGGDYIGAFFPVDAAEAIELGETYEMFLGTLGRHTRRDMRRLRRRAGAAGLTFEFGRASALGIAERHALAGVTHPAPYRPKHIDAYDAFLAAQEQGFHAQLRSPTGELLSCCAGLISDRAAFVLYQLNHRRHLKESLSLTNRAFTIEQLIGRGVREFVLPGGGEGLLTRVAQVRRSGEVALIRRSAVPILKSLALTVLSPHSTLALAARRWAAQLGRV
jgi:hypothetical protein